MILLLNLTRMRSAGLEACVTLNTYPAGRGRGCRGATTSTNNLGMHPIKRFPTLLPFDTVSPPDYPTAMSAAADRAKKAWHPKEQLVEICHSPAQRHIVGPGASLDGEQVLPGFQFPIAGLFKEWDWD